MSAETQKKYRITREQRIINLLKMAYRIGYRDGRTGHEGLPTLNMDTLDHWEYELAKATSERLF